MSGVLFNFEDSFVEVDGYRFYSNLPVTVFDYFEGQRLVHAEVWLDENKKEVPKEKIKECISKAMLVFKGV